MCRLSRVYVRLLYLLVIATLTLTGLPQSLQAQSASAANRKKRFERLERQLEDLRELLMIPGMSAAVVKDQKLIWTQGFGFADYEKRVPATENTPYRIASLTKTFASTLVMQLVEQGKVSLDDSMSKYSTDFKDDSVKLRHLLSHTSEGVPGEKYRYDGSRFAYLDAVIEKASGVTFRELLTERILTKLKMSDSVPGHDVLEQPNKLKDTSGAKTSQRYENVLAQLAKPYTLYGDSQIILSPYPRKRITAAADFVSTVVDLAKYDQAIDRHLLLRKETQNAAWTPAISNGGQTLPYGLGWFAQNYQGVKLIWHYGQWQTFSALHLKVPEKNLTFILLANSSALSTPFDLGAGDVTKSSFALTFLRTFVFEDLQRRVLPDLNWRLEPEKLSTEAASFEKQTNGYKYERELQSRRAIYDWRNRLRARERQEIKLDSSVLDAYVGEYELLRPLPIFITREDNKPFVITKEVDKLMGEGPGQPKAELFAATETLFFLKTADADITFAKDENGKVTHLTLHLFGLNFKAKKLK